MLSSIPDSGENAKLADHMDMEKRKVACTEKTEKEKANRIVREISK